MAKYFSSFTYCELAILQKYVFYVRLYRHEKMRQ